MTDIFQVALQLPQDSRVRVRVECESSLTSFFLKVDSRFRLFFRRPRRREDSAESAPPGGIIGREGAMHKSTEHDKFDGSLHWKPRELTSL